MSDLTFYQNYNVEKNGKECKDYTLLLETFDIRQERILGLLEDRIPIKEIRYNYFSDKYIDYDYFDFNDPYQPDKTNYRELYFFSVSEDNFKKVFADFLELWDNFKKYPIVQFYSLINYKYNKKGFIINEKTLTFVNEDFTDFPISFSLDHLEVIAYFKTDFKTVPSPVFSSRKYHVYIVEDQSGKQILLHSIDCDSETDTSITQTYQNSLITIDYQLSNLIGIILRSLCTSEMEAQYLLKLYRNDELVLISEKGDRGDSEYRAKFHAKLADHEILVETTYYEKRGNDGGYQDFNVRIIINDRPLPYLYDLDLTI
ncbi:MAG: hypothetical protein ACTSYA_00055 [Candidatus Kariarchaeaceae archaeon]